MKYERRMAIAKKAIAAFDEEKKGTAYPCAWTDGDKSRRAMAKELAFLFEQIEGGENGMEDDVLAECWSKEMYDADCNMESDYSCGDNYYMLATIAMKMYRVAT